MLDINILLMCFSFVVFLGLLIYLNKYLYSPILNFMANRDAMLEKDRQSIDKNESDTAGNLEEVARIILEAKNQAAKEKNSIVSQAKAEVSEKLAQRNKELSEDYASFLITLEKNKQELKNSLLANVPSYKQGIKAKLSGL